MYTSSAAAPIPNPGARAYARIGIESAVMSASPQQLLTMLFDGAKAAISMARHHMASGDVVAKGNAISKAVSIIDSGLKASLDAEAGGSAGAELAANLSALYDYINQRLLYANLRNDPALLEEADRLLENIASAWREISDGSNGARINDLPARG
ncbi:flagellar export chaperone FliS [Collimonas fungivorans]|uniref:Flagellar secretion chaperone FliS n=1 Tax=Collimonas fungivorans (strain Ter331) TaxID=1005048 RepID=G0AIL9_COLFT|nr:flagellar export chaperone FliS [Collimonas fungivorans]AEK60802.1 Flagellar biosynthesis protein [Collimonas fungivorans Ter331]